MADEDRTNRYAPKPSADWERIECEYRAGLLSLREIAAQHGITEGAVRKRAKRDGWDRDLNARIQAKAEALVQRKTADDGATERQVVEASAAAIVSVRLTHRQDISRARSLVMTLLGEIEALTGDPELFDELGEIMADEAGGKAAEKMQEAFNRVTSLTGRVSNMRSLAESMRHLVALEREAYGMDKGTGAPPGPLDGLKHESLRKLLDAIAAARAAAAAA